MSVSGGPNIVENGLVFQVDTFNPRSYISGSTKWFDVVNNTTASISGISANPALYKAIPLTTSASSTTTPISFQISSSVPDIYFDSRASRFTLSVWASVLNIDANPSQNTSRGIFCRGGFSGYVGIHARRFSTGSATEIRIGTRGSVQNPQLIIEPSIITGSVDTAQIFNAVMVYDSSSMYGYFNGNYMGTISTSGVETLTFTGSWQCNSSGGPGGNTGAGTMSLYNASIYNRALSAEEVLQNFNAQRSRFGI